jgi:site-specific DNA-methyltransferase (adenine-specific)
MKIKVLNGNCLDVLSKLPEQSVNTCITSPPYYGLRDYGTAEWKGGDDGCDHQVGRFEHKASDKQKSNTASAGHQARDVCPKCGAIRKDKQLGLEETPEEYVENMVAVFREVKRVLRDDGTVWLNLGDSYSSNHTTGTKDSDTGWKHGKLSKGYHARAGGSGIGFLKTKDLIGIPWRVAFALQADGWYLRQDIIWHKPNPMPESVTDRCTKSHEYIFLLSKSLKYYFDNEAIKEDAVRYGSIPKGKKYSSELANENIFAKHTRETLNEKPVAEKRNKRSVWTVTTKPFKGAHFATFPPDLIEPCILAGCPEEICVECGTPYEREMEVIEVEPKENINISNNRKEFDSSMGGGGTSLKGHSGHFKEDGTPVVTPKKDLGFKKQCQCESNETKAGTVLDPFGGSGTTGLVADRNGRNAILIELNDEYAEMARDRLYNDAPLFVDIE